MKQLKGILIYKTVALQLAFFTLIGMCLFSFKNEISTVSVNTVSDTTESYLMLKGHVRKSPSTTNTDTKEENIWLDSALITIFYKNVPYSELWTNKKGKCSFKLSLHKLYLIEVSKDGYVSKSFEVNTKVPIGQNEAYSFDFDIDIFEKVNGLDVTILQKPIAKVAYNQIDERFAYDVAFTNKINNELKKMYKSYYLLQKEISDSIAATEGPKPLTKKPVTKK